MKMTIPIVNVYKLGRMPYVNALKIQQVLFDNLISNISSSSPSTKTTTSNNNENHSNRAENVEHFSAPNYRHISTRPHLNTINYTIPNDHTTVNSKPNIHGYMSQPRNSVLLVEHEPVYTIGLRSTSYKDDYVTELKKKLSEHETKADFVKTNRGGLITFHGPGQLVAYPIIYLGDFKDTIKNKSVRAYVNTLERVIIDTLGRVGIDGAHTVREYPGVWVGGGDRKIAFIGISCKRSVTMHGISINCDCDLSWFDHIVSCGIKDKEITSIHEELGMNSRRKVMINHQPGAIQGDSLVLNVNPRLPKQAIGLDSERGDGSLKLSQKSVDYLANVFCLSFSHYFGCRIEEKNTNNLPSKPPHLWKE